MLNIYLGQRGAVGPAKQRRRDVSFDAMPYEHDTGAAARRTNPESLFGPHLVPV